MTNLSLLVEGHFVDYGDDKPLAFFYPDKELNGDPSNWWGSNEQCLVGMIKSAGFKRVTTVAKISGGTVYGAREGRIIIKAGV